MRWILSFLWLCLFCTLQAQDRDISGYWVGTITQEEGGFRPEYKMELFIEQKGKRVSGRSFVRVDNIYAEMEITGSLHSGIYLRLADNNIISHQELEGMEWCIKDYQLLLKVDDAVWRLEGHWQGKTTFSNCVPGQILLKKSEPRA